MLNKIDFRYFLKLFIIAIVVVLFILFTIEFNNVKVVSSDIKMEEERLLKEVERVLKDVNVNVVSDLEFINKLVDNHISANQLEELSRDFLNFAIHKKVYNQIRYIDESGQEIVRVNRYGEDIELVKNNNLQYKGNRYYFKETMELHNDDIYVSKFDLNMENGEIEKPYKPMIRYAKKNDNGIVILNYLGSDILKELYGFNNLSKGKLYFINSEGYYLYSGGQYEDFSFMYKNKGDKFSDFHTGLWNELGNVGTISNKQGFLTYSKIDFNSDSNKSDSIYWVMSFIPQNSDVGRILNISYWDILGNVIYKNKALIMLLFVTSLFMSYSKRIKTKKDEKVKKTLEFTAQVKRDIEERNFLLALAKFIADECSVKYVFIDAIDDIDSKVAKTVVLIVDGEISPNVEHEWLHTPCENMYNKGLCLFSNNIQKKFPKDKLLVDMNAKSYAGVPLFGSDGNKIGLIAVVDDKKMEDSQSVALVLQLVAVRVANELEKQKLDEQTKELLEFNKKIVNITEEGILVYDKNLNYIEWNDSIARMTEVKREDVIGKYILDVFPELKENGKYDDLLRVINNGDEILREYEYINPSNRKLWFRDFNKPLRNTKGEIIGAIKTIIDITSFKENESNLIEMRKKAESANMAKSRFLANMSHELRTPLNGMLGMIDLALTSDSNIEKKECLTIAKKSILSLAAILNDILEISRIEENQINLNKRFVDLRKIANTMNELYTPLFKEKDLKFKSEISDDLPRYIKVDPVRLKQIASNLIGNALKFTNEGKVTRTIRALSKTEDKVVIRFIIKDTGIGISSDKRDEIFNRFYQVDSRLTKEYSGVGLGLSIVKSLVELMGGELHCNSKEGIGTEFYFDLELEYADEIELNDEKENIYRDKETIFKTPTVLIVEDDTINIKLLQKIIKRENYNYLLATNGKEAVNLFKKSEIDVILMDLNMPIMNGFEATNKIREIEGDDKKVFIIAQTAHAYEKDKQKCLANGFDEFITKPIDFKKLTNLISQNVRSA